LLLPLSRQTLRCRQSKPQARVAGQPCAGDQQHIVGLDLIALARPHQVHLMACLAQAHLQALDGQRDPIDLGRIGLGDDGIAHGSLPVLRMLGPGDVADMTPV
jgi:hypothetical protein